MKPLKNLIPIIQAPMAGGVTTPELVAAVSNAGAIGSFGFAYTEAEKIDSDLSETRKLTDKSINANFFVFSELRRLHIPYPIPVAEPVTMATLSADLLIFNTSLPKICLFFNQWKGHTIKAVLSFQS